MEAAKNFGCDVHRHKKALPSAVCFDVELHLLQHLFIFYIIPIVSSLIDF